MTTKRDGNHVRVGSGVDEITKVVPSHERDDLRAKLERAKAALEQIAGGAPGYSVIAQEALEAIRRSENSEFWSFVEQRSNPAKETK